MQALCQTLVLTLAMKLAVDPSVEQLPTNLTYLIHSTNAHVQNTFHHVINYQHVSFAFAIIIGVVLQEYEEYNNQVPLNVIINVSHID